MGRVSPVPAQMWAGVIPRPDADVAGVSPSAGLCAGLGSAGPIDDGSQDETKRLQPKPRQVRAKYALSIRAEYTRSIRSLRAHYAYIW